MKNNSRSKKHCCRTCSIRARCIDAKGYGPGLKLTLIQRFKNRTDTYETWAMLQQDCLLERAALARTTGKADSGTSLAERLRQAGKTDSGSSLAERLRRAGKENAGVSLAERLRQARQPVQDSRITQPLTVARHVDSGSVAVNPSTEPQGTAPTHSLRVPQARPSRLVPCGLTVVASQRLVRLPDDGEVFLGRFEHGHANPPDIDLTHEDGIIPSVSRRHAMVMGRNGSHWIEDMGSNNGTYVNGNLVPMGRSVELVPGDSILLGRCRLMHAPLPDWVLEADLQRPRAASLLVTHTAQRLSLPDKSNVIIGRPDPTLAHAPDVDLSVAGDISFYVSRRHARLVKRKGRHFLEDVGSAAGTRVNGRLIRMGETPVMLRHGDHVWLGGCVLAYEWS